MKGRIRTMRKVKLIARCKKGLGLVVTTKPNLIDFSEIVVDYSTGWCLFKECLDCEGGVVVEVGDNKFKICHFEVKRRRKGQEV